MSESKRIKLTVTLDDGTTHDIVIGNPSLVAWDRTAAQRSWPASQDAPFLWMTFIAWHHMKAARLVDCEWTEFSDSKCVAIEDTEDDEDAVGPTP